MRPAQNSPLTFGSCGNMAWVMIVLMPPTKRARPSGRLETRNPGFVHELFNDNTSYATVKHLYNFMPEVIEAYEALPEVVLRKDSFFGNASE